MLELLNFLPSDGWPRFVCDCVWQSTLVGLGTWLMDAWLIRRPARRAWLLLVGMVACAMVPLASAIVRQENAGLFGRQDLQPVSTGVQIARASRAAIEQVPDPRLHIDLPNAPRPQPHSVLVYLPTLWAAISALLVIRLTLSALATWRLVRGAEACANESIMALARKAAEHVRIGRQPEVLVSFRIVSPVVVAFGTPRVLIPHAAIDDSAIDWFGVFCHELAHVRRGDGWTRLAAELVVCALPWQPILWLLRRRLYLECDQACDDWAVAAGVNPVEFADLLTRWIPRKGTRLAPGMISSSSAARRVRRLLALRAVPKQLAGSAWKFAMTIFALATICGVALAQEREPRILKGKVLHTDEVDDLHFKTKMKLVRTGADASDAKTPSRPKPYVIGVPDILLIDALKVVPKPPYRIEPQDVLKIGAAPGSTILDQPINGDFRVDASGIVSLGFSYGKVSVVGLTTDEATDAITKHLRKMLRAPEISVTLAETSGQQQINGEHLVKPDGTVKLGVYGSVYVNGMTLDEAQKAIEKQVGKFLLNPKISVDVYAYNSQVIYLVVDQGDGSQLTRLPWTGRETVLYVLAGEKLVVTPKTKIWILRAGGPTGKDRKIDIDWSELVGGQIAESNQLQPSDRLFVVNPGKSKSPAEEETKK